ncbi:MAG: glycosyltransferase [Pseudomonadota bacterium]
MACFSSFWLTKLTIKLTNQHQVGGDESLGVQKFHDHWVSRVAGVPIYAAFFFTVLQAAWLLDADVDLTVRLLVCSFPAFAIGLFEDLTRSVGVMPRLVFTMISAALGWWLLSARLVRVDVPWLDALLAVSPLAVFVLTLIAAAGIAHAVNIIDGYNGLSGFFILSAFCALAIVSAQHHDTFLMQVCLIAAACVAGFLVWNFPFGRIFLGDAGAYFLGFLLAEVSILLVVRNPGVSAWCPMLIMVYPVWETLFSMARRARDGLSQMGQADALHLHQLVYRRLMKRYIGSPKPSDLLLRNSLTSVYLWIAILLSIVPAVLFSGNTLVLASFCGLFAVSYVIAYRKIVALRVPRFLVVRQKQAFRSASRPGE